MDEAEMMKVGEELWERTMDYVADGYDMERAQDKAEHDMMVQLAIEHHTPRT